MINLMQGDCLELMKSIPNKSVDMILCDLPYGTTRNKWDCVIPFKPLWEQYNRIIKDNGAILLFGNQPFVTDLINSKRELYKYNLIWEKNIGGNFLNSKKQPLRFYEEICVFYKKQPVYNNVNAVKSHWKRKSPQKNKAYGKVTKTEFDGITGCNRNVLKFDIVTGSDKRRLHSSQKPVALLEYLIKTYANEGEIVLDNCMGSMSTVIACLNTKRKCIAMEKDKNYFRIGCNRVKQHILDNGIDLFYNQVNGGGILWQNLEIELAKDTEDF